MVSATSADEAGRLAEFERHRGHLWGVAYRIMGTKADADDALQEAWLRWRNAGEAQVRDVRAYLTTTVSRICYDVLTSARARREAYAGPWLPEPVVQELGPEDRAALDDSVSMALLAVLERLTAAERVAFVLHDAFSVPFAEIADVLGRSDEAVRRLASRARARVREHGPRRTTDRSTHRKAVEAFTAAALNGDLSGLVAVLDPEVVWRSDGGGVVSAAMQPVSGADRVARLVRGTMERWMQGMDVEFAEVNGAFGAVVRAADGTVDTVVAFAVAEDGRITEVDVVRNPEKLTRV
ncbi:RNA polymerase sigma factor SigJ [Nonomuraea sp. NPDC049504]|uniref:RNA polymerase sigma factor SigJ n=1 Tax=Nonomuraea sp. NPDC049504 TaxID=3154729 RepID=UPI0034165F0C